MDPRLQRRIQRGGWDRAAGDYQRLWGPQLAPAHAAVLAAAALAAGEHVLDIACGSGQVSVAAARAVGDGGRVVGIDLSERMAAAVTRAARAQGLGSLDGLRMDGEALAFADASFDAVLCSLGLMYMPEPEQALREAHRVLRPGGRLVAAVWGEPARCGWAALFAIVDAEVASEVCPSFYRLGVHDALARACTEARFVATQSTRIEVTLDYADAELACEAAFVGGPVALAWARFSDAARARAQRRYLEAIEPWRCGAGYRIPGQFVVVAARRAPITSSQRVWK